MESDAFSSGHFDFDIPEDEELESNVISEAAGAIVSDTSEDDREAGDVPTSDIRVVTNKLHGDRQQQLFLHRFLDKVHNEGDRAAYTWLADKELNVSHTLTLKQLHDRASLVAYKLVHNYKVEKGDRLMIVYEFGLEFLVGFVVGLLANCTVVSVVPPNPNPKDGITFEDELNKFRMYVDDSGTKLILTSSKLKLLLTASKLHRSNYKYLAGLTFIATNSLEMKAALISTGKRVVTLECEPEDIAFIQYTSGSTGKPKGVMISHSALTWNCEFMRAGILNAGTCIANFCPQYHDAGFIQFLLVMVTDCRMIAMSPFLFIQHPLCFLKLVNRDKCELFFAPNFALGLMCKRMREQGISFDLSHVKQICIAAEPINPSVLSDMIGMGFPKHAITTCYGMAEMVLYACHGGKGCINVFPSCGIVDPANKNIEIIVVDEESNRSVQNSIGTIYLRGRNLSSGYWKRPQLNEERFQCRVSGYDGVWFDTHDVGLLKDEELYVIGRTEDRIVLQTVDANEVLLQGAEVSELAKKRDSTLRVGARDTLLRASMLLRSPPAAQSARNLAICRDKLQMTRHRSLFVRSSLSVAKSSKTHVVTIYPQQIEWLIEEKVKRVRLGTTAVFQYDEQSIGVALECYPDLYENTAELQLVVERIVEIGKDNYHFKGGLLVSSVFVLEKNVIPKTTSGKLRRQEIRERSTGLLWNSSRVLAHYSNGKIQFRREHAKHIVLEIADGMSESGSHAGASSNIDCIKTFVIVNSILVGVLTIVSKWLFGVAVRKLLLLNEEDVPSSQDGLYNFVFLTGLSEYDVLYMIIGVGILQALCIGLMSGLPLHIGAAEAKLLRKRIGDRALQAYYNINQNESSINEVQNLIFGKVATIEDFISNCKYQRYANYATLFLGLVLIFVFSKYIFGLIAVGALTLVVLCDMLFQRFRGAKLTEQLLLRRSRINNYFVDVLHNRDVVVLSNMQPFEQGRLAYLEAGVIRFMCALSNYYITLRATTSIILVMLFPIICFVALANATDITYTDSVLIALLLIDELHKARTRLEFQNLKAEHYDEALKSIHAWLELNTTDDAVSLMSHSVAKTSPKPMEKNQLSIVDLDIGYDSDSLLLRGVSITLSAGDKIAITGESGCGKSTLLKAMMGLIKPQSGRILFNQTLEVDDSTVTEYRQHICCLNQTAVLFRRTIRENVLYGCKNAEMVTDDMIFEALAKVKLLEWVQSLPDGLRTILEHSEKSVSGGQAQRLHLCRVFLTNKDCSVYFLDEPTSALDPLSRSIIIDNLKSFFASKLVVIVTHHSDMLKLCNKVFKVHNNTLVPVE